MAQTGDHRDLRSKIRCSLLIRHATILVQHLDHNIAPRCEQCPAAHISCLSSADALPKFQISKVQPFVRRQVQGALKLLMRRRASSGRQAKGVVSAQCSLRRHLREASTCRFGRGASADQCRHAALRRRPRLQRTSGAALSDEPPLASLLGSTFNTHNRRSSCRERLTYFAGRYEAHVLSIVQHHASLSWGQVDHAHPRRRP
mmetsp:Transcript_54994/g.138910  ORF Transcript_54994/g.138910 Transcript_54994/m.138910 type:complete len:202 (-) Transcript_54994:1255-1860(-)